MEKQDSTIKGMTDFFEISVENLDPKEDKKKSSVAAKKSKKSHRKRKQEDSVSNNIESSKKFPVEHSSVKKYCILQAKCSHTMNKCKDLRSSINRRREKTQVSWKGQPWPK